MFDLKHVEAEGARFTKEVGELLGVDLTPETSTKLFLAAMGSLRSELYRSCLFYGQEADKCRSSGAYFAACIMHASAIESLLAVLCLTCQKEIEDSGLNKKFKRGKGYEEKVLKADFQDYIDVASHLGWIPSDAMANDLLVAAMQDFPLVVANLYPDLSEEDRRNKVKRFAQNPGIEMLRILQHMRNFVHGSRWARVGITATAHDLESDSKFAFVVASQVMFCLTNTFIRLATEGLARANEIKDKLSPEGFEVVRSKISAIVAPR
jgi:hypothetical protein